MILEFILQPSNTRSSFSIKYKNPFRNEGAQIIKEMLLAIL